MVVGPGTHQIAVHAYGAAVTTGTVSIRWQVIAVPTSTPAGAASRIPGNGSYMGTTAGLTPSMTGSCEAMSVSAPDTAHFFTMCPSTTRTLAANTCVASYDTVLYLRGTDASDLACDDDLCTGSNGSTFTRSVSGPGVYVLVVDGFASGSGTYTLAVSGL